MSRARTQFPKKGRIPSYEDLGLCPCGARIGASYGEGAVIHELPMCQAYTSLNPLQFLVYVRKARGISDN